jgi:Vam6/Vps39-like protein vacuolar protein sorting-associated protein 39
MRSERLLNSLPKSFKLEQALVLGRLGRHDEALKILYCDCKSIDLALEYCDMLHERREIRKEKERARLAASGLLDDRTTDELDRRFEKENAYLPLVRVALESDADKKRGTASAIQILAMRRNEIDRAAALRLLPNNVPVSAVARPFLIPALVDSESQARRLKVVSSLLRARHTALKQQLTEAQLKAQANLHVVPQFRSLNLEEPIHSTKPFKARPSSSASSTFPDVVIVKHFFPRHVVIQAKVTNNAYAVDGRALGNIAFVVAESSEEAIQPSTQVPIKVLPFKASGSAWCVLVAAPNRMEGTAILTCELRYTVLGVDATSGTPVSFGGQGTSGRTFVEELQDIEVFASHFS